MNELPIEKPKMKNTRTITKVETGYMISELNEVVIQKDDLYSAKKNLETQLENAKKTIEALTAEIAKVDEALKE